MAAGHSESLRRPLSRMTAGLSWLPGVMSSHFTGDGSEAVLPSADIRLNFTEIAEHNDSYPFLGLEIQP